MPVNAMCTANDVEYDCGVRSTVCLVRTSTRQGP